MVVKGVKHKLHKMILKNLNAKPHELIVRVNSILRGVVELLLHTPSTHSVKRSVLGNRLLSLENVG